RPEAGRGHGQDAAPRAHVEDAAQRTGARAPLEGGQAEPGALVGAGSEGQAGLDDDHAIAGRRGCGGLPRGHDPERARGERPEALPDACDPVHLGDLGRRDLDAQGPQRIPQPVFEAAFVGEVGEDDGAPILEAERLSARRPQIPEHRRERLLVVPGQEESEGLQPRMSFTLPRKERSFSCSSGEGRDLPSWSIISRCSAVSLVGTTTRTVTWRSPRPRPPRCGTPWPRTRNVVPLCVPSGTWTLVLPPPPTLGTSMDVPSAGCAMPMGTSHRRAAPSRWKNSCSSTRTTTYRSPGGPPALPASPSPLMRSWLPVSTPPGILIWSLRSTVTWPSPPQSLQGVATMRPVPWQRPQVRATLKNPCWNVTWPRPPHDVHVLGEVPGAAPLPWQVAHGSARGIWMWVSVPKTASSKPRSRL